LISAGGADASVNTADFQTTAGNSLLYNPALGEVGDVIGVFIHNENNPTYKPYAIRAATPYTAPTIIDETSGAEVRTSGSAVFKIDSWDATFPVVTDFTKDIDTFDLTELTQVMWNTVAICDQTVWASEDACLGIWKPW
jgi:hypothetical protein